MSRNVEVPPRRGAGRLAGDIGGTFTDVVFEIGDRRTTAKVLTTHDQPEQGLIEGVLAAIAQAGASPGDVEVVLHGTTLATNVLIERKGARVALVCTRGFRDSIEIAYEHRFEQYDLFMRRPDPLVPRWHRFEITERLAADGSILLPLDESEIPGLVEDLRREEIEAVAICCLHSYANDAHEQRLGEILGAALPELSLSLSSEVSPEIREYDRMSTTAANAYVRPKMNSYLGRLQDELRHRGFGCPLLMIMSSGGMTTLETARKFPIRLVESGPAGGAIFSGVVARQCNEDKVLSFDMGGTTAKICLLDAGKPQLARSTEVAREYRFLKGSGIPIRVPVIEMVEIGAGGGSIAGVSELGTIAVGPTSAGSEPGPASYGRGGVAPTVTDADLVLGRLDPLHFAGGSFDLSIDAAAAAIDTIIGKPLGYDPLVAATGISEIVDENMANAAQIHGAESGKELAERTLIAFGGAAPNHAVRVAEKLGMDKIIIPVNASVGSAVGFLRAPIAYEVIRSRLLDLRQFSPDIPNGIFAEIRREAQNVVGPVAQDIELFEVRTAYMRYRGQGHEIPVSVPAGELTGQDRDRLHRSFEDEYRRVFGRIIPKLTSEIVSWGLSLGTEPQVPASIGEPKRCRQIAGRTRRRLFDTQTESAVEVPAFERAELAPGDWCDGPCVVVEDETSTFVSGNFVLGVNDLGYLVLTRRTTS